MKGKNGDSFGPRSGPPTFFADLRPCIWRVKLTDEEAGCRQQSADQDEIGVTVSRELIEQVDVEHDEAVRNAVDDTVDDGRREHHN